MRRFKLTLSILMIVLLSVPLWADEGDVEIHGFGSWGIGKTWSKDELEQYKFNIDNPPATLVMPDGISRKNNFQYGRFRTDMSTADFALNISASPYDDLTIFSQIMLETYQRETNILLDYAFAEYMVNDYLIFRGGKVKQPFGLYNEIVRVGTTRPFTLLPQSVYGPQAMTGVAYKGLGIGGKYFTDSDWGFEYDVYGGSLLLDRTPNYGRTYGLMTDEEYQDLTEKTYVDYLRQMVGAKFVVNTPYSFYFGISGFMTRSEEDRKPRDGSPEQKDINTNMYNYGAFFRLTYAGFDFSTEFVMSTIHAPEIVYAIVNEETMERKNIESNDNKGKAFYAMLSYRFATHFQIALLYDFYDYDTSDNTDAIPSGLDKDSGKLTYLQFADSKFTEHRDMAVALNYWIYPNLVLKTEYHYVKGLGYAAPDKNVHDFYLNVYNKKAYNVGYETTHLLQGSIQFSF